MHDLLPIAQETELEVRLDAGLLRKPLDIAGQQLALPAPTIVRRQRRRHSVGEISRPMAARKTLPVAQAHLTRASPVPVTDMHVGVNEPLRLAVMQRKCAHRYRPDIVAA